MGAPPVIPLKDDIASRRFPVVTVTLIAAGAVALLAVGDAPSPWLVLVSGVFLWLFGPSLEDAMGPVRYVVFLAAGAAVAGAIEPDAGVAAAGAVGAAMGGYAVLYPRAHVVALGLVPGMMSVFELPALVVLAAWVPLQALAGGTDPAPLAGLVLGALAVRILAHRAQHDHHSPGDLPAY
jgi:membrane associated rhomboid family serine protease